jgi:ubiquinone/menaquinone biosynthesis C-methylase UbiE
MQTSMTSPAIARVLAVASGKNSMANPSIARIIATANGSAWLHRRESIQKILTPEALRQCLSIETYGNGTDLSGQGVYAYATEQREAAAPTMTSNNNSTTVSEGNSTNYDIVNAWQVNYARGECGLDGGLLSMSGRCYDDDAMFGSFYASRPASKVLDVGCNTGKNMTRALQNSGPGAEAYGIEFSSDSVEVARKIHGANRTFQGDASANFVDEHGWSNNFSTVQCTAVLQHLTPEHVQRALENMSRCLKPGGELLLTFKDSPTKEQMKNMGMGNWADEVFTADIADKEGYLRDGFLRAIMWDDDYYPGVTSPEHASKNRDFIMPGIHRREFVFYSLQWMKSNAMRFGFVAEHVEVMPDSKIPLSALHWMVVFRRVEAV